MTDGFYLSIALAAFFGIKFILPVRPPGGCVPMRKLYAPLLTCVAFCALVGALYLSALAIEAQISHILGAVR